MNISLNTIRYFLEAAKYENFSKAAHQLYTAQPNLSKRVAELERTIGVRLFQRTGKQVHLTEAGRHLYEEWSAALDKIDQALRQAQALEQMQQDTLTLGLLEGMSVLPNNSQRLEEFQSRHPNINLRLERLGIEHLQHKFDAGCLDMIVTTELEGKTPVLSSTCARRVVSTCHGAIAINVRNPMAERTTLTLPMLRDESFIVISREEFPQGYHMLQDICRRAGFEPRIIREAISIESLLLYVEAGMGISLVSDTNRLISNPDIRFIPLDDLLFDTVVYWHTDPLRQVVRALVDYM